MNFFERHFYKEFGDSLLNFEVVCFVQDPEYHLCMEIQPAINLALRTLPLQRATGGTHG